MEKLEEFERYLEHLNEGLGHADRRAGLKGYCAGLMAPLKRKSVEPMAAHVEPGNARAKHQSLHHFVSQAAWSDEEMLKRVAQWVVPRMDFSAGGWWVVDDTGFPKQGRHSVGVARQYCGMLGKQDSCQVAVSVSLACEKASLPVAWRLYMPQEWIDDEERRKKAAVPQDVEFATKPSIALAQIKRLMDEGAPRYCVLADAGYGVDTAFREGLSELGLSYAVGVTASVTVWPPGHEPLPAKPYSGRGRTGERLRIGDEPEQRPRSVKEVAFALEPTAWQDVTWRDGTNFTLCSRFARVRVRSAHRTEKRSQLPPEQWLLIEWPQGHKEPLKYWLSTLPEDLALKRMVFEAKMRWRIERDYQDLKQEVGLGHYEGRSWRGFHHHASLSIAAYGFLVAHQLQHLARNDKKKSAACEEPALPTHYKPRGSPAHAAPRPIVDNIFTAAYRRRSDALPAQVPLLRESQQ